jgi:hypothetical protein
MRYGAQKRILRKMHGKKSIALFIEVRLAYGTNDTISSLSSR